MIMRKMATLREIDEILPIEGADAIEVAVVGGWKVVVKKGEFKPGMRAVYCEIDSWIPTKLAPYLSKGKEPREFEGIKGERLRTIKLRGQLSQGLLLNLDLALPFTNSFQIGDDVSEVLGIVKWEKPMNAQLAGVCKGNFPSLIPKTDQERVQNLKSEIRAAFESGLLFEVTEKMEGSSMTCYLIDGEFGVCSRNMDLKRDENNSFWKVAVEDNIENKMREYGVISDWAIQGELIGPGIQGNIYKLSKPEFRVFDVYNIQAGDYLKPVYRRDLISRMGLNHVPVITVGKDLGTGTMDELLEWAEGESVLAKTEREGIVFKQENGGMTFKAISNKYLLKGGE
jgi:RNA ligase (TIGR02306 family)